MSTHLERARRYDLSFPVCFREGGGEVQGHCMNLSVSGLLASFLEPPELWTAGELLLEFAQQSVTVRARVARVGERQAGFSFVLADQRERDVVRDLVASAERSSRLVGAPPF